MQPCNAICKVPVPSTPPVGGPGHNVAPVVATGCVQLETLRHKRFPGPQPELPHDLRKPRLHREVFGAAGHCIGEYNPQESPECHAVGGAEAGLDWGRASTGFNEIGIVGVIVKANDKTLKKPPKNVK